MNAPFPGSSAFAEHDDFDDVILGCAAEQVGQCDDCGYSHWCEYDSDHGATHHCECGHTWTDPDNDN